MPAPSLPPPSRLGKYELGAPLAEGGMAVIYSALCDGAPVAMKMVRRELVRDAEFMKMFFDEAGIATRLRHPGIVRTYELGRLNDQAFLAMELLHGQPLEAVARVCHERGIRLRYEMIAWLGARAAEALHYAHELRGDDGHPLGIVHRDVSPSNLFITDAGEMKVIDFGLALARNRASKTAAGIIKGKIAYMSPEQSVGETVDRRTDVFALATTLWELACDRRLFKGDDPVETLRNVNAAKVPDPRGLVAGFPDALWAILSRALSREREDRTSTAAELAEELDRFAGTGVGAGVIAQVMGQLFARPPAAAIAPAIPPAPTRATEGRGSGTLLVWWIVAVVVVVGAIAAAVLAAR